MGRFAGPPVVAGGLQQGGGGIGALAVEPLDLFEGFGGLLEPVELLQAVRPFATGLGGRQVLGVALDEALVRGHGLCAARVAPIGAGQQKPGLGYVPRTRVVPDEVGE